MIQETRVFLKTSIRVVKTTDDGAGTTTRADTGSESEYEEISEGDLDNPYFVTNLKNTIKRLKAKV